MRKRTRGKIAKNENAQAAIATLLRNGIHSRARDERERVPQRRKPRRQRDRKHADCGEKGGADQRGRIALTFHGHEQRDEQRHELHQSHHEECGTVLRSPRLPRCELGRDRRRNDGVTAIDGQLDGPTDLEVRFDRHPVQATADWMAIGGGDVIAGPKAGALGRAAGDHVVNQNLADVGAQTHAERGRPPYVTVDEQRPISEEGCRDHDNTELRQSVFHGSPALYGCNLSRSALLPFTPSGVLRRCNVRRELLLLRVKPGT